MNINDFYKNSRDEIFVTIDSVDFDGNARGFIDVDGNMYKILSFETSMPVIVSPEQTTLKVKYAGPSQITVNTAIAQYKDGDYLTTEAYCKEISER